MSKENKMFSSLLKYWRGKRGLSQLDLALKADVSTRHISFLETGRSQPSQEMVLRLVEALDLPLRERNTLLLEAGFEAMFPEPEMSALDQPVTRNILELMMKKHEPYPLIIMDRWYEIVLMNQGAQNLLRACLGPRIVNVDQTRNINAMIALFEEDMIKTSVLEWEVVAREMLARLHRELLHRPLDRKLASLIDTLQSMPGVPSDWREPDLSRGSNAILPFRFGAAGETLEFVTTITTFSTPQNVTLQELQIESYFPLDPQSDDAWVRVCEGL